MLGFFEDHSLANVLCNQGPLCAFGVPFAVIQAGKMILPCPCLFSSALRLSRLFTIRQLSVLDILLKLRYEMAMRFR